MHFGSVRTFSFYNEDDRAWADEQWLPIEQFFQNGIDNGLFRNMPPCMLGYLSIGSVLSISQTQRGNPFEMTAELEEQLIQASWRHSGGLTPIKAYNGEQNEKVDGYHVTGRPVVVWQCDWF